MIGGVAGVIFGNETIGEEAEDLGVPVSKLGGDTWQHVALNFGIGAVEGLLVVAAGHAYYFINSVK